MHDDDDALWTGQAGDAELEAIEDTLGTLRWQPRELELGGAPEEAPVIATVPRASSRRRVLVPVLVGVVAAAAVFALLVWLRPAVFSAPAPINPVAPPATEQPRRVSPDLKDPFARPDIDEPTSPPEPEVPPEPGTLSPDLKDPFAGTRRDPPPRPKPREPSPDLKDPFERSRADEPEAKPRPKLQDPFGGESKEVDPNSPDLKDPFQRD